ncbi:MAG: gliding motility-associated C-terminal domain-containing protein, partial [Bacteroidaceae bacterium]|nr:gliding motility-associated C-terminal domain-containing protein [Bacteroidaceae bacterium]
GWSAHYDWVVYLDTTSTERSYEVLLHRFDEDLEYNFIQKGRYKVRVRATFTRDGQTVVYPSEEMDSVCFTFEINRSRLKFPNTFTPNGDQINDTLRAKEFQSIVEFRAIVFNRWGKKLYSWDDVNTGWDGKVGGSYVNDGAYYLVVNAKGADGHIYHIKKTINVLTTKFDDLSVDPSGGDTP